LRILDRFISVLFCLFRPYLTETVWKTMLSIHIVKFIFSLARFSPLILERVFFIFIQVILAILIKKYLRTSKGT
jgi:hypothetical protein